jgi:hypothetical protein
METIEGSCHCGNISYRFETSRALAELALRRCSCSFCRSHGAVYTSDPQGRLTVDIREPQAVSHYRFGTRTAEPLICARCGVLPVTIARIDGRTYGVVNLSAASGFTVLADQVAPQDFSKQTAEQRSERRRRSWIATVTLTPAL